MSDKLRYPIYIPSKGRAATPLTARALTRMGVDFAFVVESTEVDEYKALRLGTVLALPFHDLGQGSIPARNWIWDHAIERGAERHWIIDDNIHSFARLNFNRRVQVLTGAPFRACEDFTDRYDNIAFSGLHNRGFIPERELRPPFYLNGRIYSMTLINTALPYRWRGRFNEDTDICLRALKDGWATIQFNWFLGAKAGTMKMRGGNTDTVYAGGDHRRAFAESLVEQHPDVARVTWKYNRWHHEVDYSGFANNRFALKPGVTPTVGPDEYGMRLVRVNQDDADAQDDLLDETGPAEADVPTEAPMEAPPGMPLEDARPCTRTQCVGRQTVAAVYADLNERWWKCQSCARVDREETRPRATQGALWNTKV